MSTAKEINIYGAGMAGLVAAINLAREGYPVTVHERESKYGGSQLYNPSTHVTPINTKRMSDYIGIDVTSAFHEVGRPIPFYFHDTRVGIPNPGFYAVERGDRPTSLDTLLYKQCQELDVSFEFGSPLKKKDLDNLPPNSIIACGLTPSAYEMLGLPHLRWYGWISRGESGVSDYARIWWDECITEYGYFSSVNDYYFDLLFSKNEISRRDLDKYKRFIVRNEGFEHDDWQYVSGVVPIRTPDNPRLFWNDAILCGTMSGTQDPWFWFGITGALLTGKISALAVTDREAAVREFERFNRKFQFFFAIKNKIWYPFVRPNVGLIEKVINGFGVDRANRMAESVAKRARAGKLNMQLVPGFGHYNYS